MLCGISITCSHAVQLSLQYSRRIFWGRLSFQEGEWRESGCPGALGAQSTRGQGDQLKENVIYPNPSECMALKYLRDTVSFQKLISRSRRSAVILVEPVGLCEGVGSKCCLILSAAGVLCSEGSLLLFFFCCKIKAKYFTRVTSTILNELCLGLERNKLDLRPSLIQGRLCLQQLLCKLCNSLSSSFQ